MFRAYDPERDRLVAIKLLKLDLAPERVHQLLAELERLIAVRLTHPAIVAPIETAIDGVRAYIAQEFVPADSLDVVLRSGPLSPADTLQVVTQVAGALDAGAVVQIPYGALHPRDILLSGDQARVTGIGLARCLERVDVPAPVRRPYAAPERAEGGSWDRRADIFTLAALTYEMLSGRRLRATADAAGDLVPTFDGADQEALRELFRRGLADHPDDRFERALEFAYELKVALPQPAERSRRDVTTLLTDDEPDRTVDRAAIDETPTGPAAPADAVTSDDAETPGAIAPGFAGEDVAVMEDIARVSLPVDQPVEVPIVASAGALDLYPSEPPRFTLAESPRVTLAESPRFTLAEPPEAEVRVKPDPPTAARPEPVAAMDVAALPEPRAQSAISPLAFALLIGAAIGFAAGFGVGVRSGLDAPGDTAAPPPAAAAAPEQPHEYTETTVPQSQGTTDSTAVAAAAPIAQPSRGSEAAPVTGTLLVRSTPAAARVVVDGRDYGRTPITVGQLSRGVHTVQIAREGYGPDERTITITPERPAHSIIVRLTPERAPVNRVSSSVNKPRAAARPEAATTGRGVGALSVESRPEGASVFIDGQPVGTTPLLLPDVAAGEHAIHLELDGYKRWASAVRIVPSERNRVTASLDR